MLHPNIQLPALKDSSSDERFDFKSAIAALVEVRGFEPLTPWLQTMCSAN